MELAQQERKSIRYRILEPVCVQAWCVCPSLFLYECAHAPMQHKHIHSHNSASLRRALGGQQGLSVTVMHCLAGMDVEGSGQDFFLSCPPSLERVSASLVPSCLMRWDPLLAGGRQHQAREKKKIKKERKKRKPETEC